MPFARLRELTLTLRFRLTLWVTLIVLVLVVLSMVAIAQVVRRSLVFEFDALLRKNVSDMRYLVREQTEHAHLFQRLEEVVRESEQINFAQIFDSGGRLLWRSTLAPDLPSPSEDTTHEECSDHGNLRYIEGHDSNKGLHFRLGISRASLDEDIALVNRIMVLSSVCIFVLLPLAGLFLAGRATRPLQWIIATTGRLQPERLNERLPVRSTGDELDQLSVTINGMLDRIASYIQKNREFVSSAAHELRSPLAAIRSSVEVALNRPRSNEEYAELLENVTEECARLGNLVDRLLLLAEGDAGQLSLTEHTTHLDKIVRESVDMFQGVAEVRDVPLVLESVSPALVHGDESYIRQVVRNLIDNALKFTSPPGRVSLCLTVMPGQNAVLRVHDEGLGITPEDLPHIFERFYRGDKSRQRLRDRSGNGLGLSICESIIHALHGSIQVESHKGMGTTFTVELPLAQVEFPAQG